MEQGACWDLDLGTNDTINVLTTVDNSKDIPIVAPSEEYHLKFAITES